MSLISLRGIWSVIIVFSDPMYLQVCINEAEFIVAAETIVGVEQTALALWPVEPLIRQHRSNIVLVSVNTYDSDPRTSSYDIWEIERETGSLFPNWM